MKPAFAMTTARLASVGLLASFGLAAVSGITAVELASVVGTLAGLACAVVLLALPVAALALRAFRPQSGERPSLRRLTGLAAVGAGSMYLLVTFVSTTTPGDNKVLAYAAAMRSDLQNLTYVQTEHFGRTGRYPREFDAGQFAVSSGVVGPAIQLTPDGWTASVGHRMTTTTCTIYHGGTPIPPAQKPGEPACTGEVQQVRRGYLRRGTPLALIGVVLGLVAVRMARSSKPPLEESGRFEDEARSGP